MCRVLELSGVRVALVALVLVAASPAHTQDWRLAGKLSDWVTRESEGKLKIGVELRSRYERGSGIAFGRETDAGALLVHTRFGASFKPASWIRVRAGIQDSRNPYYLPGATPSARRDVDLHEAYFELFPDRHTGFGMAAGRSMLTYGEGRLVGTSPWASTSGTYDFARAYYRRPRGQVELLFVSPVKDRNGAFNRPALGDHMWGVYNTFPNVFGKSLFEAYALRRSRNSGFTEADRPTGTDRQGVNTFGFRLAGPFASGVKYSVEGAVQAGKTGTATHRAGAWFSRLNRQVVVLGRQLEVSGEYKFASGIRGAGSSRSGTFDQLYAANHNKFGQQELFGWRNIHNTRAQASLSVTRNLLLNGIYNNFWLASPSDALYSGAGRVIARSANGAAGRHVGQEMGVFATYRHHRLLFGAGYGRLHKGEFIRKATPAVGGGYAYVFQAYSF